MNKKRTAFLLMLAAVLFLPGCWNYRGLNEMTVVVGLAVDKNGENGQYRLTFEFIDVTAPLKDKGPSGKLVEAEGKTIFDAVRNAKKKVRHKLYFGHTQVIIFSKEIAQNEDMLAIMDWFMRDSECRETMYVGISQEETAARILQAKVVDHKVVSINLKEMVESDNEVTGSTIEVELHNAYEQLKTPGRDLALTAFSIVPNEGEEASSINGIAVFRNTSLVGFLSPEESKGYLFAMGIAKGGLLPFASVEGGEDDSALEVHKSKTERKLFRQGDRVGMEISVEISAYLAEYMRPNTELSVKQIGEIENRVARETEAEFEKVIRKLQEEYRADILGFGELIYRRDYKLWKQLEGDWDSRFPGAPVEVSVKINIVNTASLKKS